VLAKDLGREYFRFDEAAKQLVGDETGETYRIGQRLTRDRSVLQRQCALLLGSLAVAAL